MLKYTKITTLAWLLAFLPMSGNSQTCKTGSITATTPTSQFIDNGNGTVSDKKTGLTWKRCSEGQNWTGTTCEGDAKGYTWQEALQRAKNSNTSGGYAGRTDWRVPNIKELRSITEKQCVLPSINLTVFPNTKATLLSPDGVKTPFFWSSSPVYSQGEDPWVVDFDYAVDYGGFKNDTYQVRLVRGG